jgi:hypothetical protein
MLSRWELIVNSVIQLVEVVRFLEEILVLKLDYLIADLPVQLDMRLLQEVIVTPAHLDITIKEQV